MKLPRQVYLTGNAKLTGEGKYFGNYQENTILQEGQIIKRKNTNVQMYLVETTNIFEIIRRTIFYGKGKYF